MIQIKKVNINVYWYKSRIRSRKYFHEGVLNTK